MQKTPSKTISFASRHRCGLVLAGGDGKRLRSFVFRTSGTDLPKQYVRLVGDHSMLEHTYRRVEKIISPDRLFTVVCERHLAYAEARRQIASRPRSTIIVQPENKDTGPGLLLPLVYLASRFPRATVAVFPSDHFILQEDLFMIYVYLAFRLIEKKPSRLVLLGIQPEKPESEYGYIIPGQTLPDLFPLGTRQIEAFVEKPGPQTVRHVIDHGGLWNTMVMIFKPETLLRRIRPIAGGLYDAFRRIAATIGKPAYAETVRDIYRDLEPLNFCKGLLEPMARQDPSDLTVLPIRGVHWSDWGSQRRILTSLKLIGDAQSQVRFAAGRAFEVSPAPNRELGH